MNKITRCIIIGCFLACHAVAATLQVGTPIEEARLRMKEAFYRTTMLSMMASKGYILEMWDVGGEVLIATVEQESQKITRLEYFIIGHGGTKIERESWTFTVLLFDPALGRLTLEISPPSKTSGADSTELEPPVYADPFDE